MGNNVSWTILEEQVIELYDLGALTLPVLDVLCGVFRNTDIDAGGSRDLQTKDGKSFTQVCVGLVNPAFVETDEWTDYDEFDSISGERWGWR